MNSKLEKELREFDFEGMELPRQVRSQMEFGNEGDDRPIVLLFKGIRPLLVALALALGIGISANAEQPFSKDESRISYADLAYFCDSISFDNGKWSFELSKNSVGLTWRLSSLKRQKDVIGVCKKEQALVVPDGDMLLLKGKDYFVAFVPKDFGIFKVSAHLEPGFQNSLKNRTRDETLLKAKPGGAYAILSETH